ncbi:MAG: hypothetical protein ACKOAD_01640 [Gammaproteobacteria bacterium]
MLYKKLKIVLLCLFCFCNINISFADTSKFDNLSILVTSCDKYSELWDPFFQLLWKQWPELNNQDSGIPIYLMSNSKKYTHPKVQTINIVKETSWSSSMRQAVKEIKTDYVLVVLDDYFFTKVDQKRLSDIFNSIKSRKIPYVQLTVPYYVQDRKVYEDEAVTGLKYKKQFEEWRTSLQAAIWRKDVLLHLLKEPETPWNFEIVGSARSEGMLEPFLVVENNFPLEYLNMAQMGYLSHENILKVNSEYKLNWTPVSLPVDKDHKINRWWHRRVLPFLYWSVWLPVKQGIKKIV